MNSLIEPEKKHSLIKILRNTGNIIVVAHSMPFSSIMDLT
jgi:hypothetical protein